MTGSQIGRRVALAAALGWASASVSCATYSDKTEAARSALRRGDYDGSIKQLNGILKVRKADDLPAKWKKNFALVVLERAMVLQAKGDYELSARDFSAAEKELEFLDIQRDGAGKVGKYIYSDSATVYKTSPTEKLSLNAINMLNYLARGDLSGAKVEARRFTTMRDYFRDYDPEHEHGAFGSYLAGFVYEREGNADEALRYYDEALQERDFGSLAAPIRRLAKRGSFRGERIRDYLPSDTPLTRPEPAKPAPATKPSTPSTPATTSPTPTATPDPSAATDGAAPSTSTPEPSEPSEPSDSDAPSTDDVERSRPDVPLQKPEPPPGLAMVASSAQRWDSVAAAPSGPPAEILVVAKVGRVPYKIPKRIPIGAAIGIAGAFVTGDTTLLEYGMFKVVTYPELVSAENLFVDADMRIDGQRVPMEKASDLGAEIIAEYDELRPKIIGAALTRMIARAAAAEGARAAGKQAKGGAGGIVGFLAAAAVEGTLVALDKPDTRSWSTLPGHVYVGRLVVPPGAHRVEVTAYGPGGKSVTTTDVKVPSGGWIVLDVTTLR